MILEDLRDFQLLRDDLLRGVIEESVAAAGPPAKVYNETRRSRTPRRRDARRRRQRRHARHHARLRLHEAARDETNREIDASSSLGFRVASARNDTGLLAAVAKARTTFDDAHDCLSHGDLHAGSVMVDGARTVAIDAEFACRGPAGLDIAFLIAGYVFAFCAADATRGRGGGRN